MEENNNKNEEIKEYADGWITERKGTDAPVFLKFAYIVISLGCVAYLIVYMNGETSHGDRGVLVEAFNKVTGTANGFMYFVAALCLIYAGILIAFVFKKFRD